MMEYKVQSTANTSNHYATPPKHFLSYSSKNATSVSTITGPCLWGDHHLWRIKENVQEFNKATQLKQETEDHLETGILRGVPGRLLTLCIT